MLARLLGLRYAYAIAVAFTLINSVVVLLAGVRQRLEGYRTCSCCRRSCSSSRSGCT